MRIKKHTYSIFSTNFPFVCTSQHSMQRKEHTACCQYIVQYISARKQNQNFVGISLHHRGRPFSELRCSSRQDEGSDEITMKV